MYIKFTHGCNIRTKLKQVDWNQYSNCLFIIYYYTLTLASTRARTYTCVRVNLHEHNLKNIHYKVLPKPCHLKSNTMLKYNQCITKKNLLYFFGQNNGIGFALLYHLWLK